MKTNLLLTLLIISSITVFSQQKYTISGNIKDSESGEDLIGAAIFVKELGTGTVANVYGFYSITLPEGKYNLTYSYIGFRPQSMEINLTQSIKKNIELATNTEVLKEFEVIGEAENKNVESIEMSVVKMDMATLKKIPALMGEVDLLRSIQLLPGVQSGGEGSTGFFVRGGGLDQNLILVDGAPIYNASHLLGFFSIFNSDAIKGAKLYKGGIPAEFGGRLSSVLDVNMKEGNQRKLAVTGGIGLISSRLTIEGPIVKDKLSFIVSGRRTYVDAFLPLSSKEEIRQSKLWFYDLNAKVNWKINDKNRIFVSSYNGRDVMGINNSFQINWGNRTASVRWNHIFSDKLFSNFTYINSLFDYSVGIPTGSNAFEWNSKILDNSLKNDYTYYLNPKNKIDFGFQSTFHKFTPAEFFPLSDASDFDTLRLANQYAWENAIYISNEQKIGARVSLKYGIRYSSFSNTTYLENDTILSYDENYNVSDTTVYTGKFNPYNNYNGPEPRLSVKYLLNETSSVKASYNRMRQYLHLASNSSGGTPFDIWIPSSPNIRPQLADQIALGYFKNFKQNMFETSVEVYYKSLASQIDFKDNAQLLFNPRLEGEIRTGKASAYGLEVYIHKQKGKLTGWISYTLSRTMRTIPTINNGNPYQANYNRTHNLAIVASYELNKRVNISANWIYTSGAPITVPIGAYIYQGQTVLIYSERNGGKMPDYHRFDIAMTYDFKKFKKFEHSLTISAYNTYARKNAYSINIIDKDNITYVKNAEGKIEGVYVQEAQLTYLFSIVPSITYNFNF